MGSGFHFLDICEFRRVDTPDFQTGSDEIIEACLLLHTQDGHGQVGDQGETLKKALLRNSEKQFKQWYESSLEEKLRQNEMQHGILLYLNF
jgi:hypothetical protein